MLAKSPVSTANGVAASRRNAVSHAATLTHEAPIVQRHPERGIALILTLFLVSALSVLAAALMFLSQTETYASMNYQMMSQSRYAAEVRRPQGGEFPARLDAVPPCLARSPIR